MRVSNWVMLLALATVGVSGCGKGADQVAGGESSTAQADRIKDVQITVNPPNGQAPAGSSDVTFNEYESLWHSHNKIKFELTDGTTCKYRLDIQVKDQASALSLPPDCSEYYKFFDTISDVRNSTPIDLKSRPKDKNVCVKYEIVLEAKDCSRITIDPWAISKK